MKKVSFFKSIQLKFIIIYILLILIAIQVIGSYVSRALEQELVETYRETINNRVDLLSYNLEIAFNKDRDEESEDVSLEQEVQNIIAEMERGSFEIVQVINGQERVIATNDFQNQHIVGKKSMDPYVQRAIKFASSIDNTAINSRTGERVLIRVEPLYDRSNDVVGVLYVEASLENVYSQQKEINEIFLNGSIIAIFVSVILGILVARAITRPIVEMRRQALTMARGDFSQKVKVYGNDEISQLAVTFNHLNDRLKHLIAAVEGEERKLNSVIENMSEGVIATDEKGKITLINESAGKLLGRDPNHLYAKDLLQELKLEDQWEDISNLYESGEVLLDLSEGEDVYLLRANFTPIYQDHYSEMISGYITVLSVVTEERKIEQERREFVSNVSHELRTPLTSLRSYLEALADGAYKDPNIAPKFLQVTQDETERMIRMVNSLLQLSRMDSDKQTYNKGRNDFVSLFHTVIDRFEMNKKNSHIHFERYIPNEVMNVWIDRDQIIQVLDNILSNAVKYSPDGGTISCRVEKQQGRLIVCIKDEGIGIAYDKLDKIFERFYRVDKARTRQFGGTGLGLAITQEIIEAHFGKIWATSKENKGTSIFFTLPLMDYGRRRNK